VELPLVAFISFGAMLVMAMTGFGEHIVFQWGWYVASIFGLCSGHFAEALSIISICALPLNMIQALHLRQHLNRSLGVTWGVTAAAASVPGVMILVGHDGVQLKVAFGILLLLLFAWEACIEWRLRRPRLREAPPKFEVGAKTLPVVLSTGTIAGTLSGLFATPSPAFTIFILMTNIGKDEFRSTQVFVMTVFLVPVRILVLGGLGLNLAALKYHYLAGFFGGVLGLSLGDHLSKRVSNMQWRWAVSFFQLFFGVSFVCAPYVLPDAI